MAQRVPHFIHTAKIIFLGFTLLGCAVGAPLRAPNQVANIGILNVPPESTAEGIGQARGPHVAYWNRKFSNGFLLITIGGTTSLPSDFSRFSKVAVERGFHVIGVDYPNFTNTRDCRESADPQCFDNFREEIVTGRAVSDKVDVNAVNGLENRIAKLIQVLVVHDTRWSEFMKDGQLDWSKVWLVGHSQGSGHAVYLSKRHAVYRVIAFAGPQDHFTDRPAPWLSRPSATSAERYYALLHAGDEYGVEFQKRVFDMLSAGKPENLTHRWLSEKPVNDPHNAVLYEAFYEEWAYLLSFQN